jgi:hypothetical protein
MGWVLFFAGVGYLIMGPAGAFVLGLLWIGVVVGK